MKLGEMIKQRRKELKMTQTALALAVGVDFSYISKIESGGTKIPSQAILEAISKELDLDIEEMKVAGEVLPQNILDVITNQPKVLDLISAIGEKEVSNDDIGSLISLI